MAVQQHADPAAAVASDAEVADARSALLTPGGLFVNAQGLVLRTG